MSFTREYGKLVFECDSGEGSRCEDLVDTGEGDFHEAVKLIRSKGWLVTRTGADWLHTCPACPKPR